MRDLRVALSAAYSMTNIAHGTWIRRPYRDCGIGLERHSKRADEFFGSGRAPEEGTANTDAHLLKLFSDPIGASNHFSAWAALVADLQLARGMRVLGRLMWHRATDTRIFYLTKNATGPADSRQGLGLDARAASGGVRLGARRYDRSRPLVDFDYLRWSLPGDGVDPGDVVEVEVTLPEDSAEQHVVFDLVAENVTWFAKVAATAINVPASV